MQVPVDDRRAREQRHDPAERPGTDRTGWRSCGPALTPRRAITTAPTSAPASDAAEEGDRHRAAEEQAEHRGELDVAHPHPARVGEREHEQEAAGRRAGDQLLGTPEDR